MNALHTAFEAAPEAAMGKIPVVKMTSADPVKAGQATNYQPVFQIVAWVDRPDVLGPRTVPAPRASALSMFRSARCRRPRSRRWRRPRCPRR